MIIDNPGPRHIPALRSLWHQAFGDREEFIDCFFEKGFSYDRCRCVFSEGEPIGAVYFFEGSWRGEKIAYLYGLAIEENHQKQGFSRLLLADTHANLLQMGFTGAVIHPGDDGLRQYYERLGYRVFGGREERVCAMALPVITATQLGCLAYEQQRRAFLPSDGILQEGAFTEFLQSQATLYGGEDFVAAVSEDGMVLEFLGNAKQIPHFLASMQIPSAVVRTPGNNTPSMYLDFFGRQPSPAYFGLPMD